MTEKYGFVYIWFDRKHKKYYVGCHWGTVDDGYICSSRWMKKAYKRRTNDFKRRILKNNLSRIQMYEEEQRCFNMIKQEELGIKYYNLNITHTASPLWHAYPEEVKTIGQKISYSKKGKSNGPHSNETKAKIASTKQKKIEDGYVFSEEHREKLSKARLGYKHTEEWKQQNSEKVKEQWATGIRSGYSHTEEHNKKIGDSLRGRTLKTDQVKFLKEINSQEYTITYMDGKVIVVKGLKQFGLDNNIPYVTLHKSYRQKLPIYKYSIEQIEKNNTL